MKQGWPLYLLTIWMFVGCTSVDEHFRMRQHASLMENWTIYEHCRASHDPDAMWADSYRLRLAAQTMKAQQPWHILPEVVERLLSKLPPRWSVDPDAMAADCSLRAGLTAQEKGRSRLAEALFRSVAMTYPIDRYAFYVEQARQHLQEHELIAVLSERSLLPVARNHEANIQGTGDYELGQDGRNNRSIRTAAREEMKYEGQEQLSPVSMDVAVDLGHRCALPLANVGSRLFFLLEGEEPEEGRIVGIFQRLAPATLFSPSHTSSPDNNGSGCRFHLG